MERFTQSQQVSEIYKLWILIVFTRTPYFKYWVSLFPDCWYERFVLETPLCLLPVSFRQGGIIIESDMALSSKSNKGRRLLETIRILRNMCIWGAFLRLSGGLRSWCHGWVPSIESCSLWGGEWKRVQGKLVIIFLAFKLLSKAGQTPLWCFMAN